MVADLLSAPSTPAYALLGTSCADPFFARLSPWNLYSSASFQIPQVMANSQLITNCEFSLLLLIDRRERDLGLRSLTSCQLPPPPPARCPAHPVPTLFLQGFRLGIFTAALRFKSLDQSLIHN